MNCPNCGNPVKPTAAFCGTCGTRLMVPTTVPGPVPAPEPLSAPNPNPVNVMPQRTAYLAIAGLNTKWVGAAIFATIIVVASLAVGSGSASVGRASSPQQLADMLTENYNNLFRSDFDDESLDAFASDVVDSMPKDIINKALEETGYTRDDVVDEVKEGMEGSLSSIESIIDDVSVTAQVSVGDRIDSDEIDDLEDTFKDHDLRLDIDEGYELDLTATIVAKDDIGTMQKGDKEDNTVSGVLEAFSIDGRWYLWYDMF